jgi:hypothetical protein
VTGAVVRVGAAAQLASCGKTVRAVARNSAVPVATASAFRAHVRSSVATCRSVSATDIQTAEVTACW